MRFLNIRFWLKALALSSALWSLDLHAWEALQPGLQYEQRSLDGGGTLHLVKIDPKQYQFRIVSAPAKTRQTVAAMRPPETLVAINGSYFDEAGKALGLVISEGRIQNPLNRRGWGIFFLRDHIPSIVLPESYQASPTPDMAIEVGPRLVIAGTIPKFKNDRLAPRSAIGITSDRQVLIAASPWGMLMKDFAEALKADCTDALNLDGGPSTQFYLKTGDKTVEIPGAPVANGIVVVR